jgi:hypothetical protein
MRSWIGKGFETFDGRAAQAYEVVAPSKEVARRALNDVAGWVVLRRGEMGEGRVVGDTQMRVLVKWAGSDQWVEASSARGARKRLRVLSALDREGQAIHRVRLNFSLEQSVADKLMDLANRYCEGNRTEMLSRLISRAEDQSS